MRLLQSTLRHQREREGGREGEREGGREKERELINSPLSNLLHLCELLRGISNTHYGSCAREKRREDKMVESVILND